MIQINIFKQHLKLFFKSRLQKYCMLLMYLTTTIGIGFYLYFPSDVFFTLTFVVRCIFYESFVFMIVSYLFLKKAYKNNLDETIHAVSHHNNFYFLNALVVLTFLLLLYNLYIFILLFINTMKTGEYHTLINILKSQYLLNVLLPQYVFLLIIALISLIKNSKISISLFLVVSVLMSPYMDTLTWRVQPSFPIDQIIHYIHLPFALFLQSSMWPIDPLYGMQNEPYKIAAVIFWIFLFIFIMMTFYRHSQRKRILILLSSLLVVGSFSAIYIPQDIFRIDQRWNGTLADSNYYDIENRYQENIYTNQTVDYTIRDYKLDIQMKYMLEVNGQLQLHSPHKQKDFVLTLYHQYDIDLLQSSQDLTYKREGDYIYIRFSENISDAILNISYHGYHNLYFSNTQGVQLPGFFPWYPMAGEKSVYFNNGSSTQLLLGINPYNKIEKASFTVHLNTPYNIVCNLDKQGDDYVGTSDSLTIIGGNVAEYADNTYQIQNYFPYNHSPYYTAQDGLMNIEKDMKTLYDMLTLLDVESSVLRQKKVIVCSQSNARTQVLGTYAEFDDYIIITSETYIWQNFLNYHMAYRFDINPEFSDTILSFLYFSRDSKAKLINELKNVLNNKIENLQLASQTNKDAEEKLKFDIALLDQINQMNEEEQNEWMKEIGKIIIGEDIYGN